jgi:hypothetical protein
MKTVFDEATRDGLIARIETLNEDSMALWGKMNVHQMVMHCIKGDSTYLAQKSYKQIFIGKLFGKTALKQLLKDEAPMRRNSPTSPDFIIEETTGDLQALKKQWIELVNGYEHYQTPSITHFFFGKMTREQIGRLAYKHIDHHLRQFGA